MNCEIASWLSRSANCSARAASISATDIGRVRKINQDMPLEGVNLYAVADGMGGHVGGEVAARVAVETLEQAFERAPTAARGGDGPPLGMFTPKIVGQPKVELIRASA